VKRSGRDEPVEVAIHMCMEAVLGISVNIFISNYKKHYVFVIIFYDSFAIKSEKNRVEQVIPRSRERGRGC
jgi:hypothetical protein